MGIRRPSVETARSNREPFQLPKSLRSRGHKALLAVLDAPCEFPFGGRLGGQ
jgi:hypothetical protein